MENIKLNFPLCPSEILKTLLHDSNKEIAPVEKKQRFIFEIRQHGNVAMDLHKERPKKYQSKENILI